MENKGLNNEITGKFMSMLIALLWDDIPAGIDFESAFHKFVLSFICPQVFIFKLLPVYFSSPAYSIYLVAMSQVYLSDAIQLDHTVAKY